MSLCIDPDSRLDQNCPDFRHVEVALYKAASWSEEYEHAGTPELTTLAGQTVVLNLDTEGDEAINREFFEFLRAVLHEPEAEAAILKATGGPARLGVQLLDSALSESWHLAA